MKKAAMMLLLLALTSVVGTGCVAQGELDHLQTQYRVGEEQNEELRALLAEAQLRLETLNDAAPADDLSGELAAARDRIIEIEGALSDAEHGLRSAATHHVLPQSLDERLAQLAAANPNLMSYDPNLGMIKIASDLTFASGSDVVNHGAAESLKLLAPIFNSSDATTYEVRVVGHTDSTPIKHSRDKHPTNWHLSVHRSIAVKQVLSQAGVPPARLSVAGYGQQRPLAPDGPKGHRLNRRVEIFLVPDHYQPVAPLTTTPHDPQDMPVTEVRVDESAFK